LGKRGRAAPWPSSAAAAVFLVDPTRELMEGEYQGRVKDGKLHGVGVCVYTDGSRYQGDWKSGLKSGRGTHSFASGDQFEGEWENGWMHGLGVYTWKIGDKYIGEVRGRSSEPCSRHGHRPCRRPRAGAPGAVRSDPRLRHVHVAHEQQAPRPRSGAGPEAWWRWRRLAHSPVRLLHARLTRAPPFRSGQATFSRASGRRASRS
jgi:hypothetical protein